MLEQGLQLGIADHHFKLLLDHGAEVPLMQLEQQQRSEEVSCSKTKA